ncbi:ABC transporter permease [Blastococcus goldschmidtiae]|uniref:Transport permease protein n=1 Tax=Blastococcus goldschmidtiae TaxID=3075546 RepID=A0ABU2K5H1_9ACTN|nr:ABC transporter permease [Blastococcus sp. DSM 46792]MDT0275442.1 ABC transporter permease [Blastococcus sp. DSM 46792]
MTAVQTTPVKPASRPPIHPPSLVRASMTIVWRNLIHIRRMPEMLLDVTVQSVMFVLLFAYVFGGAIAVEGSNYREFLLPGIMVQTMVFSSAIVAMGLTNDLQKGFVDRFKSLPVPRPAVLVGRSLSSLIHSSIGVAVMGVTGLLIGWRVRNGVVDGVLGFLLLLLFGFAVIWLGIWVGSLMRTVESVQGFMFTVMFPLTFVANTFVPTESMPSWLRTIAEWNPVSAIAQACRELWGNGPIAGPEAAWPLQHPIAMSIAWSLVLTAIFAPLAVSAFRRRSRD